jgi:prepilin-type processing-associated H-X9-DG protein
MGLGVALYTNDNDGGYPTFVGSVRPQVALWSDTIGGDLYMEVGLLDCPSDQTREPGVNYYDFDDLQDTNPSYGFNCRYFWRPDYSSGHFKTPWNVEDHTKADMDMLVSDYPDFYMSTNGYYTNADYFWTVFCNWGGIPQAHPAVGFDSYNNVLFGDGHVGPVTGAEYWPDYYNNGSLHDGVQLQ